MKNIKATIIVVASVLGFVFTSPVFGLTVSPAKLEINGDPGNVLVGTIEVFNEQEKNQIFYTSFENFEPDGDTGAPRFVGSESGLATWFSAPEIIELAPQERREIPFQLAIPNNAEAGGYFAAIFFGNQPPVNEGGEVSIGGRLGVLALLRVNGDIPEGGGVVEFSTLDGKNFYTMPPIEFNYRFSNTGGDRVIPLGDIVINNTFGNKRATINANANEGSVLPASARRFTSVWETSEDRPDGLWQTIQEQWEHFYFGWYTAHLNLGWGTMNQSSDTSISFFIFPWQLLLTLIIALVILYFLMKIVKNRYKASLLKELQQQVAVTQKSNIPKRTKKPVNPKEISTVKKSRIQKKFRKIQIDEE